MRYAGLRSLFFKVPDELLLASLRAPSTSSTGTAATASAAAAARPRAIAPASARRNARNAGSSRIRASRRP